MEYAVLGLAGIAALIFLLVVVAAFRPSDFRISRSLAIGASADKLFPYLNNLHKFQEWSPYKDRDPTAVNEFSGPESGPGATFRWSGNKAVGEGTMKIVDQADDSAVKIDLEFIKPFAARNVAEFTLTPLGNGTEVTWSMSGRYKLMPKVVGLFINMDRMIGGDFEKGLQRLKSLVEK